MNTYILQDGSWVEGVPVEGQEYKEETISDSGQISFVVKLKSPEERKIAPKSFLSRFTNAEYVDIDLASIDDPQGTEQERIQAATLRLFLTKVNSARFIDLDDDETIQGINTLVQFDLLTSVRAYEILNDEVKEKERI